MVLKNQHKRYKNKEKKFKCEAQLDEISKRVELLFLQK